MLLYEHPLSSYAQKVKIALREKGLDFKAETPPALGSGKAEGQFAAASPRNEVPALIDGDAQIFDSTIILEYLEDKFPSPPLLPRDPAARAKARMIEDVCDTLYEAINWGLSEIRWFKRAEGEQAEKMTAIARARPPSCRPGSPTSSARPSGSMAKASAGPISASRPTSTAPSTMASARRPIRRWPHGATRIRERPSVAATFREFEAAAERMGDAAGRLASGAIRREYRDHRLEWMMKSGGVQVVLDGLAKNNIRFTWPLG